MCCWKHLSCGARSLAGFSPYLSIQGKAVAVAVAALVLRAWPYPSCLGTLLQSLHCCSCRQVQPGIQYLAIEQKLRTDTPRNENTPIAHPFAYHVRTRDLPTVPSQRSRRASVPCPSHTRLVFFPCRACLHRFQSQTSRAYQMGTASMWFTINTVNVQPSAVNLGRSHHSITPTRLPAARFRGWATKKV